MEASAAEVIGLFRAGADPFARSIRGIHEVAPMTCDGARQAAPTTEPLDANAAAFGKLPQRFRSWYAIRSRVEAAHAKAPTRGRRG